MKKLVQHVTRSGQIEWVSARESNEPSRGGKIVEYIAGTVLIIGLVIVAALVVLSSNP